MSRTLAYYSQLRFLRPLKTISFPTDEPARLEDLYAYEILDTDPEEPFDDIVALAAAICATPMARVNFVDAQRQWAKAVVNMDREDTPREDAFCAHTILAPGGLLVVEDAAADPRFERNPIVAGDPEIRFYAGSAIRHGATGRPLGAVCVLDTVPRRLRPEQLRSLERLSRLATTQLDLRRLLTGERHVSDELRELDRQKAEFTAVVVHEFRGPLTSIHGYAELLADDDIQTSVAVGAIGRASDRLIRLVDDLAGTPSALDYAPVDLAELASAAVDQVRPAATSDGVSIQCDAARTVVEGDAQRLAQVLDNLIRNAVKYAPGGTVRVRVRSEEADAVVEVRDDGVGIPADELPRVFERFYRASTARGFSGTGIGLAVAKAIVEAHHGTIDLASAPSVGTTVTVRLPRG